MYSCERPDKPQPSRWVEDFPRLEVPLSGCYEAQIQKDGQPLTVHLRHGTALFVPPNCSVRPTWRRQVRLMSLLFTRKRLGIKIVTTRGGSEAGLKLQQFFETWPQAGPLPRILDAMLELHAAGGPLAALPELVRALLCCLEGPAVAPAGEPVNPTQALLDNVCAWLRDHLQHDVSREAVARQFGISPNYLSRVFHVHGQITFSGYLTRVRTDRAKQLLGTYGLKLDDVAARCGYRDTAYFCRVFKRLTKITPAGYRARFRPPPPAPPGNGE